MNQRIKWIAVMLFVLGLKSACAASPKPFPPTSNSTATVQGWVTYDKQTSQNDIINLDDLIEMKRTYSSVMKVGWQLTITRYKDKTWPDPYRIRYTTLSDKPLKAVFTERRYWWGTANGETIMAEFEMVKKGRIVFDIFAFPDKLLTTIIIEVK